MAEDKAKTTTRGLIETDLGPLRRFRGTLDSIGEDIRTFEPRPGSKQVVVRTSVIKKLNFKDIDVKEAVEPYHFPVYTVSVPLSNRKKSRWGVLSEGTSSNREVGFNSIADQQYSAEQLNPESSEYIKPSDRMDIEDAIGKVMGMVLTDGEEGRPKPSDLFDGRANEGEGADVPTPAWTVYEIEGIGTAGGAESTPLDLAIALLDGKTLAEFNKAALESPTIRGDVALLQSIGMPPSAKNSFANTMIATGKFTKDEEKVFHLVV